jgi:hypothetical protein
MKKSQNVLVWLRKIGFGPSFLHSLLRLVKGTEKPNTMLEKNVINMI